MANETKPIKTYMSYGLPVDPANVKTLVDLDLSYALASTLVDWTDSRNLNEGLAKISESNKDKEITFKLRAEAKWSDGTQITADQVVKSFQRAKKLHGEDLKSLFEIIEKIEAKEPHSVVFHLNRPVSKSHIFHKLTEPMYGVVFVSDNGEADLSKTSGPFFMKSQTPQELTLAANLHWYGRETNMADKIIIRQPKAQATGDQDGFVGDPWPNLVASSSLMPKELEAKYTKEHFSIWNRNLDRVFFFTPSTHLANADGRQFLQALNHKIDRTALLKGLAGYHLSEQFFPPGYVIFDPEFKASKAIPEIPSRFKGKTLELLSAEGRLGAALKQNITEILKQLTGQAPHFTIVPLSGFEKARAAGDYDILVASLPVNDPNVEGAVSFFFGMTPPLIPNSTNDGAGNFKARIVAARSLEEARRNAEYRKVFTQSIQDGCLLPLFHFSSIVIAREGIDLSRVPTSDETVAFSKVRFK